MRKVRSLATSVAVAMLLGLLLAADPSAPAPRSYATGVCSPTATSFTGTGTSDITSATYGESGVVYAELTFTSTVPCSWVVPDGLSSVDIVVVGGGGAGGYGSRGGGGGAGEVAYMTGYGVTAGASLTTEIGSGGVRFSAEMDGTQTTFGSVIALGGGRGGGDAGRAATGGSSGGRNGYPTARGALNATTSANPGFTHLAHAGGSTDGDSWGAGGGGAGGPASAATVYAIASDEPDGGDSVTLFGSELAGGGGGWMGGSNSSSGGGSVGGGWKAAPGNLNKPAAANTGSGGTSGESGADGVVILRFQKINQTVSWSPTTSLTLADSGLSLSATRTLGDGTLGYTVVSQGTTGCSVSGSTLTFSSTGSGGSGCEIRPTLTATTSYNALTNAATVTFDVSRGTFAISAPSSKVGTSSTSFTNVCTSSCDVSGFAAADEVSVVVSKSGGGGLSGRVRLGSTSGLTQSLDGYQIDATASGGFTELGFEGTQAEVNAALETLQYKSPSGGVDETIAISASLAGAAYFSGTGHYYEVVSGDNKTHAAAITAAASRTFNGLNGYLATILTEEENRFIDGKISDRSVWVGGKYNGSVWQWITGPVAGQIDFWTGTNPGTAISGVYAEWEPGQPDGSDVCLSTNYDGVDADDLGNWDDLTCNSTKKWVVEYGGNGGIVLKEASTSFRVGVSVTVSGAGGGDGSSGGSSASNPVVTPTTPVATPRQTRLTLVGPNTDPVPRPVERLGLVFDPNAPSRATIGGAPANLVKTPVGSKDLSVAAGAFQFGVSLADADGAEVQTDTPSQSPELFVPRGQSAAVSGKGSYPGSFVQLFLPGNGDDSRELARIPVRSDGTFASDLSFQSGALELPVPIGRQVLQVVGYDELGNQTVVDMTVNIGQGVPAPEPNRQAGALPALTAGQSLATSGGIPESVSVTGVPEAGNVVVEGSGWVISVNADRDNGVVENADGNVLVRLNPSSVGTTSGNGFLPGTLATVWLFSEPTLVATVSVNDAGEFSAEFLVDARLIAPGEHTLQVQGVGSDGYIKAANLGVLVEEPVELTTDSASGLWWWVIGAFLLALLFLLVLLARRRRSQEQ